MESRRECGKHCRKPFQEDVQKHIIIEKASLKAEKAGSSLKRRKAKANEEKKKVNVGIDTRIINQ